MHRVEVLWGQAQGRAILHHPGVTGEGFLEEVVPSCLLKDGHLSGRTVPQCLLLCPGFQWAFTLSS